MVDETYLPQLMFHPHESETLLCRDNDLVEEVSTVQAMLHGWKYFRWDAAVFIDWHTLGFAVLCRTSICCLWSILCGFLRL